MAGSVRPAARASALAAAMAEASSLGPGCGSRTRLTRRPMAARVRASAMAAAAPASTSMVTATVSDMRRTLPARVAPGQARFVLHNVLMMHKRAAEARGFDGGLGMLMPLPKAA